MILDGVVRDRCPYVGDLGGVIGKALLVSGDGDFSALRRTLAMFAEAQRGDGIDPVEPVPRLLDDPIHYPSYWVEASHDYVLHTGDLDYTPQVSLDAGAASRRGGIPRSPGPTA